MKIFSADAVPPPLDRPTAWAFAITNLVTLPGLGSLAAGRRVGWPQATLALTGFGLTIWWLVRTLLEWFASGELPLGVTSTLLLGLAGVACFGAAWLWALLTSLLLLREARENERIAANAKSGGSAGH